MLHFNDACTNVHSVDDFKIPKINSFEGTENWRSSKSQTLLDSNQHSHEVKHSWNYGIDKYVHMRQSKLTWSGKILLECFYIGSKQIKFCSEALEIKSKDNVHF